MILLCVVSGREPLASTRAEQSWCSHLIHTCICKILQHVVFSTDICYTRKPSIRWQRGDAIHCDVPERSEAGLAPTVESFKKEGKVPGKVHVFYYGQLQDDRLMWRSILPCEASPSQAIDKLCKRRYSSDWHWISAKEPSESAEGLPASHTAFHHVRNGLGFAVSCARVCHNRCVFTWHLKRKASSKHSCCRSSEMAQL
jgi:hypothetical protein